MAGLFDLCAAEILYGRTLQGAGVTAGLGRVIDWRTVPSGETVLEDGDPFDVTQCFLALVSERAALAALRNASQPASCL